jgi:antitoxin ParD1/3/4
MSTNVHLSPELERFARDCVDSGRYNNMSEVVRAALRLLQEREERRQQFTAMLEETIAEADREGWIPVETVLAEMDEIIKASAQTRRKSRRK